MEYKGIFSNTDVDSRQNERDGGKIYVEGNAFSAYFGLKLVNSSW